MSEFIEAAPMATGNQETVGQSPSTFLTPEQNQGMAAAATQEQPPASPAGMPMGAGRSAVEENPLEAAEEESSPEEQKQYDDLFLRVMAAVNDSRVPPKGKRSFAAELVRVLSTKGKEAYILLGQTAGLIMTQMIDLAKRQGVEYPGFIIQEVGLDLLTELTEIAREGAIKDLPDEETPEFDKLMELSALEAAKLYGEHQIKTGQADQQGHMNELQDEMQRESDSGALDDWGMEEMDPPSREALAGSIGGQQNGS
jgi:hypothetical protein